MSDSISQEEIDALIRGALGGSGQSDTLDAAQKEALTGAVSRWIEEATQAAASLLGVPVSSVRPSVADVPAMAVTDRVGFPLVVGQLAFSGQVSGPAYLALPESMAMQFLELLYGGEAPGAIGDEELGALAEGFSQMAGTALTALSALAGGAINLEPVRAFHAENFMEGAGVTEDEMVYTCDSTLTVGANTAPFSFVLPLATARSLASAVAKSAAPPPAAKPASKPASAAPGAQVAAAAALAAPTGGAPVAYEQATFRDLGGAQAPAGPGGGHGHDTRNIDLLLDVTLEVTVELGRTRRRIRDVLTLGPGSIVEIDKLAGEAVDVLVNGKLIAKGEVVIIDDKYGVRISDIISPVERVQSLK